MNIVLVMNEDADLKAVLNTCKNLKDVQRIEID